MVVDCILDRKDGNPYNPREFYQDMLAYEADDISRAMDEGTEEDVKKALCDYIKFNDYNPAICDYINSVNWLTSSNRRTKMNKKPVKSAKRPIQSMKIKPITLQDAEEAYERVKDNGNPSYGDTTYKKELCRFDDGKALFFCAGTLYDGDDFNHYCRLGIENPNAVLADFEFDYVMPWNPDNEYGDVIDTEISLPISQSDVDWLNKEANNIANGYENGELVISSRKNKEPVKSSRKPIQSMYVTQDISGNDLYTCLWSGGKDQFDSMIEDGADADDILNACEELLFREEGNPPTMTELNDLIWFEPDTIREYIGLSNPIESGCHGKSKKKGKKKAVKSSMSVRDLPREALQELKERYYAEKYDQDLSYGELANIDDIVSDEEVFDEYDGTSFTEDDFFCLASSRKAVKSAAQISEIHNATSDCFVRITRSDVPEVGKVNDTIPLYEFKDSCRSYAETTNGSYYVTMDDTYEGEYFVEFSTGDTTFAPEDQRDDPYYNESLGTLQFEVIWNPGQELCTYLNNE